MTPWLLIPIAYLLGSVSFAWLAGRLHGIELREHGSRNLGATNVGRVLGPAWGFTVFLADLAKGLIPVLIAWRVVSTSAEAGSLANLPILTGAAAILGHSFTCLHGLRGGKAVATALGVLIGLVYLVAAISLATWILVWLVGHFGMRASRSAAVGPASIVAALVMPFAHLATYPLPWSLLNLPLTIFLILVSLLVLIRHRSNIARLFNRTPPPPAQGS